MRFTRALFAALIWLIAAGAWPLADAQADDSVRANQLKAGYLLNFAKLVVWPGTPDSDSLNFCVLGASGLYDALSAGVSGKRIGNRALVAHLLGEEESRAECHVLYVDARSPASASAPPAPTAAVLTVSDAKDFSRNGGIIGLFTQDNRLRFVINLENARRAGLRIDPSLLQLAAAVEREQRP